MKIAVVDIQGYKLAKEFIPKQLSIKVGNGYGHFLFKSPYSYTSFSMKERRIVNLIENKLLHIRYSYGKIDYEEIDGILLEYLSDINDVYVGGQPERYVSSMFVSSWSKVKNFVC